jgi:hypothetical protein
MAGQQPIWPPAALHLVCLWGPGAFNGVIAAIASMIFFSTMGDAGDDSHHLSVGSVRFMCLNICCMLCYFELTLRLPRRDAVNADRAGQTGSSNPFSIVVPTC